MERNELLVLSNAGIGVSEYETLQNYVATRRMASTGWGGTPEIFALAHLLKTRIYTFSVECQTWQEHSLKVVQPSLAHLLSDGDKALYLVHTGI